MATTFHLPAAMHVHWPVLHVLHLQIAPPVPQLTFYLASPVLHALLIVIHVLMLHIAKFVVQIIHLLRVVFVHPVKHLVRLALQTAHVQLARLDII
jgi:hypothetical protein